MRRVTPSGSPRWLDVLWALALLGLFLLPTDYRAGDNTAHAHSLVQLWADATDGIVHHHDHEDEAAGHADHHGDPDVGEQHETVPASSGVHMLLTALTVLTPVMRSSAAVVCSDRRLAGRYPRVLLPPPR